MVCYISSKWLTKWERYVRYSVEELDTIDLLYLAPKKRPGQIDNSAFLTPTDHKIPGSKHPQSFLNLHESIARVLFKNYGCAIQVPSIVIASHHLRRVLSASDGLLIIDPAPRFVKCVVHDNDQQPFDWRDPDCANKIIEYFPQNMMAALATHIKDIYDTYAPNRSVRFWIKDPGLNPPYKLPTEVGGGKKKRRFSLQTLSSITFSIDILDYLKMINVMLLNSCLI